VGGGLPRLAVTEELHAKQREAARVSINRQALSPTEFMRRQALQKLFNSSHYLAGVVI
jgi:hypothetical protein